MIDKRIKFDERYDCEENKTTTFYFNAPKEMLEIFGLKKCNHPEAVSMEISIECPTDNIEAAYASVSISPTKYDKHTNSYVDYDYQDIDLCYNDINDLISLALNR